MLPVRAKSCIQSRPEAQEYLGDENGKDAYEAHEEQIRVLEANEGGYALEKAACLMKRRRGERAVRGMRRRGSGARSNRRTVMRKQALLPRAEWAISRGYSHTSVYGRILTEIFLV